MWNDEEPREPDQGFHQVASSWALVAVILVGIAGWSGIRYVIHVADPTIGMNKIPTRATPPGKETVWPSDSKAHCDGTAEQVQRGSDMGLEPGPGDARPSSPKPLACESSSINSFDLPGPATTAEWGALR